jgi:HK97 family phage prohead protease
MNEERRFAAVPAQIEIAAAGRKPKIVGYAAVFGVLSNELVTRDGRKFFERILPGAFAESLRSGADIVAHFDHSGQPLGRTSNGTLRLSEDFRGLRYEIDPADTTLARDVLALIRRGDIQASSFMFRVREPGGDSWKREDGRDGRLVRELRSVSLLDVSVVTVPAYPQTEAAVRSLEAWERGKAGGFEGSSTWMKLARMKLDLAEKSLR